MRVVGMIAPAKSEAKEVAKATSEAPVKAEAKKVKTAQKTKE